MPSCHFSLSSSPTEIQCASVESEEEEADLGDVYQPAARHEGGAGPAPGGFDALGMILEELGKKRKKQTAVGSAKKKKAKEGDEGGGAQEKVAAKKKEGGGKKVASGGTFEGEQTIEEMVTAYVLVEVSTRRVHELAVAGG